MRPDRPTPARPFRQSCRSHLDAFDGLVQALSTWAASSGIDEPSLRDVILILDELFSNIVIHGYRHDPHGDILVEAAVEEGQARVTLTDHAPLFNPLLVPEPDTTLPLEARPFGGLGLPLVRRTADGLHYGTAAPGMKGPVNRIQFTKDLRAGRARSAHEPAAHR